MHHYQATPQASTDAATATVLLDWQARTRLSQVGATSNDESRTCHETTEKTKVKEYTDQIRRAKIPILIIGGVELLRNT